MNEESYTIDVFVRGDVKSFYTNHSGTETSTTDTYKFVLRHGYAIALKSVEIVGMNSINNATNMFAGCKKLTSVDISKWNSSNIFSCYRMFRECTSLVNLDLSTMNTSNVTNLGEMFYNCTSLVNLNIVPNETNGTWNTPKVTRMDLMFYNCSALEYIYLRIILKMVKIEQTQKLYLIHQQYILCSICFKIVVR